MSALPPQEFFRNVQAKCCILREVPEFTSGGGGGFFGMGVGYFSDSVGGAEFFVTSFPKRFLVLGCFKTFYFSS